MILCLDFRSLYPLMMIMSNVYSPTKDRDFWNGSGLYPSHYANNYDGIKGKYSRKRGKVEQVLYELLQKRLTVKDKPSESLAIKIAINTCYGILGSQKFKSVYSLTAASDVTAMGRRSIHYARTILTEYGFEALYTDTDSIYVKIKDNELDKLKEVIKYIVDQQKASANIPCELHDFKIECFIKRMYFFRDDKGDFIKKHYIYVKDDDEVVVKGMKIKQGTCSKLTRQFFDDVIREKMIQNKFTLYLPDDLLSELKQYAVGKEYLFEKRYRTNDPSTYKITEGKEEATGLYYQIAKRYGKGENRLIVNKRIGCGKGNRYCKLEELKEKYGDAWIDQVKFDVFLNELSEFVVWNERKKIKKVNLTEEGEIDE